MLWERLYLGDEIVKDRICLALKKGEAMNYGEGEISAVSFPGEYDIQDVSVKCIDAGDALHYIVHIEDTRIAILQSSAALEKENIENIDQRFVMDGSIEKEIQNLELEGEVIVIEE